MNEYVLGGAAVVSVAYCYYLLWKFYQYNKKENK